MENDGKITLNLDEANQLLFKMKVSGSSKSPSKVRLVFEGSEYQFGIVGSPTLTEDDVYKFDVPALADRLDEGVYTSRVEVIVDGRYFAPIEFQTDFKRPMNVQAESLVVKKTGKTSESSKNQANATLSPVVMKEASSEPSVSVEMTNITKKQYSSLREKYRESKK